MLPLDEVREELARTERLAVRSAFALCLAFEMMQRATQRAAPAVADLQTLRAEIDRVSEALGDILSKRERANDEDASSGAAASEVSRLH